MADQFNKGEVSEMKSMLDGQALAREIGGTVLTGELNNRKIGAGFKDRNAMNDLLSHIKGARTFLNHTPKSQL